MLDLPQYLLQITVSTPNALEASAELTQSFSIVSSLGLAGRTLLSLGRYLLLPVLPRLCLTGFTFAQPFLITALIQYLSDNTASKNNGYGLIGASFLVYGGIAVSTWSSYMVFTLTPCTGIDLKQLVLSLNVQSYHNHSWWPGGCGLR